MLTAIIGWLGTLGTFVSYALVSRGHLAVSSLRYASLNTAGGLLGGSAAALYGAWPSAAANFAWAAVGIHAVSLYFQRQRNARIAPAVVERADTSSVSGQWAPQPDDGATALCAVRA
ncbi:hypothetical protein [Gordonia soli]|uniref:CBU-0592-like domain-containing protein n=1 Tax=Gordonia soli NBRC 108243 TaxID=1223545 RepID=M0QRG7_9ACTN|nr:hypothetical protein [Gordonia soli]GAC70916.1 hypothetical protein GS4_43_00430 [Gordonia soli NBRC 108243]